MGRTARAVALTAVTTLTLAATAPAHSAGLLAQADAKALELTVAGHMEGTGTVTARHDGESLTKVGPVNPPVSVLQGQRLATLGVLAQDATAGVEDGRGWSRACSGVAGDGGSVAQVGESGCLTPGDNARVLLSEVDLSHLVVADPETALAPVNQLTDPLVQQLAPVVDEVVSGVAAQTGDLGLVMDLAAIQSRCQAGPAGASGTSELTDVQVGLRGGLLGAEGVALVNLPTRPAPNTKLLTDLDVVADAVLDAVRTDLTTTLDGQAGELAPVLDEVQAQVVDAVVAEVAAHLGPLEENVLDVTLNKQERAPGEITVLAVDALVLPAAEQAGVGALVDAEVARSHCGPNGAARVASAPPPPPAPAPEPPAQVPTVVTAGADRPSPSAARPVDEGSQGRLLLGLVAMLGLGGALAGAARRPTGG